MLQAVIFDFDGVITDSEILHWESFNRVLAQYGTKISKEQYYTEYLGLTDADVFGVLLGKKLLAGEKSQAKKLLEQKNLIFDELVRGDGRIIQDVPQFLQMLERNHLPMAICSGALMAEIELIIDNASLRSFFGTIVSAEQVARGKPAPDGFLLALKRLNEKYGPIQAGQCVVIEDSHWGLNAARAAGMRTVAVTNSYAADQLKMADKIVARLGELTIKDLEKLTV